jgi:hypothetical protein
VFNTSYAQAIVGVESNQNCECPVFTETGDYLLEIIDLDDRFNDPEEFESPERVYWSTTDKKIAPDIVATEGSQLPSHLVKCYHMRLILTARSYYIDAENGKGPYVRLMVIKFDDTETDVARRIGQVRMVEEDWVKLELEWRPIVLE